MTDPARPIEDAPIAAPPTDASEGGPTHETVIDERAGEPSKATRWRLLALTVFFVASFAVAKLTGLTELVDVETVRAFMAATGVWGFFAFVVIFAIGELMHIPGLVFVGAAALAYPDGLAIAASYAGALASVSASFFVVRTIGGQPLGEVKRPWMKKVLARLDRHPIRTVAFLRLVFWMAPALNYALAMSSLRFREYFVGSALGLVIPIPIVVLAIDWVTRWAFFL